MIAGMAGGLEGLAERYDAFLIDQFGVMHDGQAPYPGAVEAMRRLTATGRPVVVLTNSGKRAQPNMARIEALGFARDCFTTVMSSGEVTWQGLRTGAFGAPFGGGRAVHVVGRMGEDYGLDGLGLTLVDDPADASFLVIAGSDCPRTGLDAYRARLAPAAAAHVPALCANPDRLMLTGSGLQPAPGAIAELYTGLGGHVTYVGKPFAPIYRQALKAAENAARAVLCIGDSLDHDVAGGAALGLDTALVRTGLLAGKSDAEVMALIDAAPHKPTVVLPGLRW